MRTSVHNARIRIEIQGTDIAAEFPVPQPVQPGSPETHPTDDGDTATVLVEDILVEGPSSAHCP